MEDYALKVGVMYLAMSPAMRWPVVAGGPVVPGAVVPVLGGWGYVYDEDGEQYTVGGFRSYADALAAALMDAESLVWGGGR